MEKNRETLFAWTLPVDKWPEEQLEAWTRDNITLKGTLPKPEWHQKQVAIWTRQVLDFDDEDQNLLKRAKITGAALLLYEDREDLKQSIGLPDGSARMLWAAIEKLKKSLAEPSERFGGRPNTPLSREDFFQAQLAQARPLQELPPISKFIASKVGASLPFVGREEFFNSLRAEIQEDYKTHLQIIECLRKYGETKFGDKLISFKFCYGPPGIGKTRCLYELVQNIVVSNPLPQIKKWHTIFIPFTNAFGFTQYDKVWPADTMLAIRLLISEVFGWKNSLADYCLELQRDQTFSFVNLQFAVQSISKEYDLDRECGILLIIDEINKCFERELPSDYVKALLTGLAQTKSPDLPYILPVFSGTSYDGFSNQVRAAGFKLTELPLGLLTGANMIAMVEKIQQQGLIPSFHQSAAFMQLLRDCGGLPRFIQIVCERAATYHEERPELPMAEWDWSYFQEICLKEIDSSYHRIPEAALIDCLLGVRIDRLNFVGAQTWGQLEMSGAVVIANRVPVVPYLALLNFVRHSADTSLTRSIWPMVKPPARMAKCLMWQDWERFNMEFAVMKLKLLFERQSEPAMNLFLPSTAKSRSLVIELIESLFIVKCRPHYIESQHQIGPSNNKLIKIAGSEQIPFPAPGQSIKNGVGAPADGILVLEYVTHSDKTPTPLLLLYSMKWTEATTLLKNETALDLQTIDEEVDKMEIHFNYLQAKKLYVICTGKPCHVENEHLPEDTVVIDKQTFASYFGPTFKSRAHAYHSS